MKANNTILIISGIIIFLISITGGGLLFNVTNTICLYIGWFVGIILVAIGLWRNDQDKKSNK